MFEELTQKLLKDITTSGKTVFVITGPTGAGKSQLAMDLAKSLGCSIISADSRQLFKEIPIGTAAPTEEDRRTIPHYFVSCLSVKDYFSASMFEEQAISLLENKLFDESKIQVVCGGSMMYVDALCKGIDAMPDVPEDIRSMMWKRYEKEGVEILSQELKLIDPDYYKCIDPRNHKRIIHALEVYLTTGKPFSSFHKNEPTRRNFHIIKLCVTMQRETLYQRINKRVDKMMELGLLDEAKAVYPMKHLNALNTVGYKELFDYLDQKTSLQEAIELIKRNSRRYARKQLTWWRRDKEIIHIPIDEYI